MNTNQYEQKVYRAMKATLAIPAANINVIAQKCGMDFKELIGILEFVDREGYLSGLRFARGGHQGTALMAFTDSVGRTAKGNEFMKRFEREGIPHIDGESRPTVFISYNEETGTEFVDFLEKKLINCATVKRFTDMDHWASFTEFMRSIREQDFAVLVITEKYLRSVACMFEVSELMKDTNWKDKVMFAVLDKKIYGMAPELIQYWQGEMEQLNNKAKEINPVNMGPITDQLKRITAIQYYFGDFIETVRDSRNPSVWEITDAIISKIKEAVTDDFVDETENEIYVQKKQEEIDRLLR